MPEECPSYDCCAGEITSYEVTPTSQVYLRTSSNPEDGGATSGDGTFEIGTEVTVVATPEVPTTIDVGVDFVMICDETSSGPDSRILLADMLPVFDAMLQALGIGSGTVPNRYGLIGFGSMATGTHGPTPDVGHTHFALGTFAGFLAAIPEIGTDPDGGPVEDNYEAISFAVQNMAWRETNNVAKVLVCINDEDRNQHLYTTGGVTQEDQFDALLAELVAEGIHFADIGSFCGIEDGNGDAIIGFTRDPDKTWKWDNATGFTNGTGGNATLEASTDPTYPTGIRTESLELALHESINGSFWDYQFFRVGIGSCDTNGTTVTRVTGNSFPFAGAVPGGGMTINGVDYVIDTVTDNDHLELTTSAGVQSGVDWSVPRNERDAFLAAFVDAMDESISRLLSWTFDGWYNSGGELLSTDASYTFIINNNTDIEARFSFALE